MREIFLKILSMGINASWIIAAVVMLRLVFRRAPKWIFGCLWMLAGLRLICPVNLESSFSLIPSGLEIRQDETDAAASRGKSDTAEAYKQMDTSAEHEETDGTASRQKTDSLAVRGKPDAATENKNDAEFVSKTGAQQKKIYGTGTKRENAVTQENDAKETVAFLRGIKIPSGVIGIMTAVWLGGAALMFLYLLGSYLYLRRKLSTATNYRENIWECEFADSPFILGFIAPRIYIPYHVESGQLDYVLAHENAHLKRRDHWIKAIAFCVLALYWFHPFVWLGYILLCRDIEFACDEKVVRDLDPAGRKEYLLTLLDCSVSRRGAKKTRAGIAPLAFGEIGIRKRIEHVKNLKRRSAGLTAAVLLVCLLVTGCLMTNPAARTEDTDTAKTDNIKTPENLLEVKLASVDLSKYAGSDLYLYYVDSKKIIFSVSEGLFVHDKETGKNVKSLDLEYIGCSMLQGDHAPQIAADKTGEKVYLRSTEPEHNALYIFDISADTLKKESYPKSKNLMSDKSLRLFHVKNQYEKTYKDGKKKKYCTLGLGMDRTAGSCSYYDQAYKGKTPAVYYPLFEPEEYGKLPSFGPNDIHDIAKIEMRIDGKMKSVTDSSLCKKMEKMLGSEAKKTGSSACSFYDPMYLTRSDGVTGLIWPATDGDDVYMSEKGYFEVKNGENMLNLLGGWQDKIMKARMSYHKGA